MNKREVVGIEQVTCLPVDVGHVDHLAAAVNDTLVIAIARSCIVNAVGPTIILWTSSLGQRPNGLSAFTTQHREFTGVAHFVLNEPEVT